MGGYSSGDDLPPAPSPHACIRSAKRAWHSTSESAQAFALDRRADQLDRGGNRSRSPIEPGVTQHHVGPARPQWKERQAKAPTGHLGPAASMTFIACSTARLSRGNGFTQLWAAQVGPARALDGGLAAAADGECHRHVPATRDHPG
jgi:hypothetical protein